MASSANDTLHHFPLIAPAADVYGWDNSDDAKVVQWTAGSGANQQWQLVPA
ncbi:hypothetical protein PV367_39590 [Streptomyces europaeiscabiei]|uniref:Ricin B lectin domain-containing protein n=1 Tax=Streptomyces europaeiscabiei TaxID=146819 RepID=A0AAJ2PZ31_9ACTN|nr:hypothetical protein [Streptomyces europaeiscabiei]MDX3135767.1 hypothetical protein [Streptomyces europaeiscabiei]